MPRPIEYNHYECRKCANKFDEPDQLSQTLIDGHRVSYNVCPLCKSKDFVEVYCAYCDFFKARNFPCGMGHSTGVPFNTSCWEWKIRSLNKRKVI